MYKVESRWDHKDSIHVEWNIGKRCNLDCTYCPSEIHDNFSKHTNIKVMLDTIDALYELDRPVRLSFTGGEPCVHPHIVEIVEHAVQRLDWVNITTNGTLPHKLYARLPVNHYVFSLHVEDDDNWERCLNNVLYWTQLNDMERGIPFQVNLMAHHEHMDRVKTCATLFDGHHVPYVVRRIRWTEKHDWFDDMKYNEKDLQWILDQKSTAKPNCVIDNEELAHANDIIKEQRNQFEGWRCAAGIQSLMINWDGDVHRATCRVGGSLGNIYDGSFEAPEEWITCTRKWCTCAADIPLTKGLVNDNN
jgi:MoaA/NifB/PqqE/SkfB family radical SAM enzyme